MECSQDLSMKQEKGKSVRMTLWSGFWQNSNNQRDILTIIPSQQSRSQVINSLSSLVSRAQRTKKEHYKNEAMEPWNHGTLEPWYHGTMVSWYHGTMAPWYHGTIVPWYHGPMAPWYHGTVVPWYHGAMVLQRHNNHTRNRGYY